MAAVSTIFLTMNRLTALSFGVMRAQFEHLMGTVCPLFILLRPWFLRFTVIFLN